MAAVGGAFGGLVQWSSEALPTLRPLQESAAACGSFQVALGAASVWPQLQLAPAALAASYLQLPGLTATLGLLQISKQHLQAGSAHLGDAVMVWGKMGVGALMAGAVWQQVPKLTAAMGVAATATAPWRSPSWWPALLLAAVATATAMQARPASLAPVAAMAAVTGGALTLGSWLADDVVGSLLVGVLLAMGAHGYAHLAQCSEWALVPPVLPLVVPGASGLRGVLLVLGGAYAEAAAIRGQAALRSLCLVLGLLAGQLGGAAAGQLVQAWRRRRPNPAISPIADSLPAL